MSLRLNKWFRGIAIGVSAIVLLLLGVRAALHVANGAAADTFTNVKGVHISWGSALVFVLALAAALVAALVARWWYARRGLGLIRSARRQPAVSDNPPSASTADMLSNTSLERTRER